jgi:ATP-binding protein involved in chromosome partitioning
MTDCDSRDVAGDGNEHNEEGLEESLINRQREAALGRIQHRILVMSGKGGVGKSTVAVNLAVSLANAGRRVGLMDADLHGPTIATMLALGHPELIQHEGRLRPAHVAGIDVVSLGMLLDDADSAVIWRGPAKAAVIKQFVEDVHWGDLDYLVVDCPPGTGDEPLSVVQNLGEVDGAVIVTTPQQVALADVRRSIGFCHTMNISVLGIVENMSGLVCPHCAGIVEVFKSGGGEELATEMDVPFLGRIPLDPRVTATADQGVPFVNTVEDSPASAAFVGVAALVLAACEEENTLHEKDTVMRIAIPLAAGRLCRHFGHCEQFALIDVNPETKEITSSSVKTPPPHEPGVIPRWLHEQGATTIIAGGMGSRAQMLCAENGITVVVGAEADTPENLTHAYLAGTLASGVNACDH